MSDPDLPIEGTTEVALPAERMWELFSDVRAWPDWNPCMWRARVSGGELREGATLYWAFNPIKPRYLYKMPAVAKIVECEPGRGVGWEASAPGFHALHRYSIEPLGPGRCRFGSWEVAEGPSFRAMRRFWLAHFRFVRDASLEGARNLAG
ncbi:MAG TPA: SRPBCC family protein [Solirubrobacterales bacterium]|nr:SRPBCC family protein [Solirubrobacterales bacterium]